jgi:hypothetical protein
VTDDAISYHVPSAYKVRLNTVNPEIKKPVPKPLSVQKVSMPIIEPPRKPVMPIYKPPEPIYTP